MASKFTSIVFGICLLLLGACNGNRANESTANAKKDTVSNAKLPAHFEYQKVNDDMVYAFHKTNGVIRAEGYLTNDKKHGYWFSYYTGKQHRIQKVEHYVEGVLHGSVKEYSLNSRLEKLANYTDGVLDGVYREYKFGKMIVDAYYENGNLDGEKRIYFEDQKYLGQIQQKIQYKNGNRHGLHQYYNENGEVVLEYKYKNGERVEQE